MQWMPPVWPVQHGPVTLAGSVCGTEQEPGGTLAQGRGEGDVLQVSLETFNKLGVYCINFLLILMCHHFRHL